MTNRTLEFYGYAYGNAPVLLNAHINGNVVFSGSVATVDEPLPGNPDLTAAPVLFSITDSTDITTDFSGNVPMTVSVANGNGVAMGNIFCNYMQTIEGSNVLVLSNSSISNNTLTIGEITSGTPAPGQRIWWGTDFQEGFVTVSNIANLAEGSIQVKPTANVAPGPMQGQQLVNVAGTSTDFVSCYNGIPTNSDNTADPRSSVTLDGVAQNPSRGSSGGTWTWIVPAGSTLGYNLNVSLGNTA